MSLIAIVDLSRFARANSAAALSHSASARVMSAFALSNVAFAWATAFSNSAGSISYSRAFSATVRLAAVSEKSRMWMVVSIFTFILFELEVEEVSILFMASKNWNKPLRSIITPYDPVPSIPKASM